MTGVQTCALPIWLHGPAALTGRASKGIANLLRKHGFEVIAHPESFLVTKQDRLQPDETARARAWGAELAENLTSRRSPGAQS